MQLELCLNRVGTLAEAIEWSLRNTCDHLSPATLVDYRERGKWLLKVIGAPDKEGGAGGGVFVALDQITYLLLLGVSKRHGPRGPVLADRLMTTSIKRRYVFLHKVMREAKGRGLLRELPEFPQLRNDGRSRKRIHTQAQFELARAKLSEPWQTWVTIGWYTGMHTYDLNRARERWFDIATPYMSTSGDVIAPGRWRRHNHKTDPHDEDTCWLPMPQGLHDWLSSRTPRGAPQDKITGRWPSAPHALSAACEQAEVPRISPIDLRRSRATILSAEGYGDEYIRVWLGHKGYGWTGPTPDGGMRKAQRPNVRTTHYYRPVPELMAPP